jgi:dolichol-phosphate mannosyltransferase
VVLTAALRLVAAIVIPVLPEEAYHWLYARHLDIGYYDHPPMIAWMIALGRLVFGDSALGLRLLPWVCSIGTSIAAAKTAQKLLGETAASWTVLLLAFQPATFVAAGFAFPDAPLLMFWSLALLFLVRAMEERRGEWWLLAGVFQGAALLSKYTSCFLSVSMLLYLVFTPQRRYWLKTPWPYLAVLVASAVFSPVLYWNATHDWASLRFQSMGRLEEGGSRAIRWWYGPAYLLLQTFVVVPFVFPAAGGAVVSAVRTKSDAGRLLLFLGLPLLAFFFVVGIKRSTHVFWPLPGWIALSILMGGYLSRDGSRIAGFYRRHWREISTISIVVVGLGIAYSVKPLVVPIRSLHGWPEITARAADLRKGLPVDGFYLGVGRRYLTPAQLAYHLRAPGEVHSKNLLGEDGLQFTYWADLNALRGRDAVVVAEADWSPRLLEQLQRVFDRVEPAGDPLVVEGSSLYKGAKEERYQFFIGHGYRPPGAP